MGDRALSPEAPADVLRHRLFPRAMAWNVQRQSASPTAEQPQLALVDAHVLRQRTGHRVDTVDVARSFPLLQASVADRGEEESFHRAVSHAARQSGPATPTRSAAEGDERERILRTVGKYLGGSTATGPHRAAQASHVYAQQTPVYYQPPPPPPLSIRRPYGGMPSPDRMTAEQQAAFQAMKISSYAEDEQRSWASQSQVLDAGLRTPPALSPTPPGLYQLRLRSPPSATSGKKRTRGSTPENDRTTGSTAVGKDEIAPSLARALLTGCGAKQCTFEGCKKIAVSKGRCRGHGGGRRCQHAGCTKCAQSRSPFCWAHGGGKRCEAPNCRRSRKTKRFCVDHVDMELTVPLKAEPDNVPKPASTRAAKASAKPSSSSTKTSSSSYASADSDDSVGRQSTVSCDSNFSAAHNKENKRIPSAECVVREQKKYVQYHQHQYAGEVSGNPPPSMQLPSLNEVLLRAVPTQYSSEAMWSSTRTPSPPAPPSSQYKSEYRSWPASND